MEVTPGKKPTPEGDSLSHVSDVAPLTLIKNLVDQTRSAQSWYNTRCRQADQWWHSQWDHQYVDGRKWGQNPDDEDENVYPWRGSSDIRDRTVDQVVAEFFTVQMFAIMNAKVQLKSTRPAVTARASQQGTTLLNW